MPNDPQTADEKILQNVQDDVAARLQADDFFQDLKVITERKGDIATEITNALAPLPEAGMTGGACVMIASLTGTCKFENVKESPLELDIVAVVLEDPLFNTGDQGTNKTALAIARRVYRVLHLYQPQGLCQTLVAAKPTIVGVEAPYNIAPLAYEVRFKAQEADFNAYPKVARPVCTLSGSLPSKVLTVTCATPEAEIWITDDGTFPWARNKNAIKYVSPITYDSALTLRISALKMGCIASDTVRVKIE